MIRVVEPSRVTVTPAIPGSPVFSTPFRFVSLKTVPLIVAACNCPAKPSMIGKIAEHIGIVHEIANKIPVNKIAFKLLFAKFIIVYPHLYVG